MNGTTSDLLRPYLVIGQAFGYKIARLHRSGVIEEGTVSSSECAEKSFVVGDDACVVAIIGRDIVRRKAVEMLSRAGCQVKATADFGEGLDLLAKSGARLVVLDADCCRGDYHLAIESLKRSAPQCTVAFLVGWWDERTIILDKICQFFLCSPLRQHQVDKLVIETIGLPEVSAV